jgi:hypothetical protein
MPTISLSSPCIDAFAFDLYSNDPRGPPKFIEHYTMKIKDGSESFACTAFMTIEFSKPYEPLQLKKVEEISVTSRRTDWLNKVGVSDRDIRDQALKGVYKELQRRKRELILNEVREEMIRCEEGKERKRLRMKRKSRCRYLMDWHWDGLHNGFLC